MTKSFRAFVGVLAIDFPTYVFALLRRNNAWLAIRNRAERLEAAPDGSGFRCDWQWTIALHAPKILPFLGRQLLRRALVDHPIRRLPQPRDYSDNPDISFIIGHRGTARLPHLLATLESIAGQRRASFECLVVEQETCSQLGGHLPDWVRYIHTRPPDADMPYCRAWAFNIGVRHARGKVLILHDNDMLIPEDYASQILFRINQGYEVVNLKRFIFFLNQTHTQKVFAGLGRLIDEAPEVIMQNAEAGGSVAITHEAYDRIGGMDESFIGWGGEDNEFWERVQTCKLWPYGYLPIVHLWHPAQPDKYQFDNPTLRRYRELSAISVDERIAHLTNGNRGDMAGPIGYTRIRTQG